MQKEPFVKEIYNAKFKQLPSGHKTLSKEEAKQIKLQHVSPLLPQQEIGSRESCALPYDLYVDGNLSDDKSKFEITFHAANQVFGGSAAGSPFNVYAPGKYAVYDNGKLIGYEAVTTWAYAGRAGDKLNDQWRVQDFEIGMYQLRV